MGNRLTQIATRTGDNGTTGLGDNTRVSKDNLRVHAMGEVDELNAVLGLLAVHCPDTPEKALLHTIQNDLFDLGADLCVPQAEGEDPAMVLRMTEPQYLRLERAIDRLNDHLQPLRSFILPGGTPAAAYLHLARTMCRRAERLMIELRDQPGEEVTPEAIQYVNRLSDFLFVASRFQNDKGAGDVLWVPGQNR